MASFGHSLFRPVGVVSRSSSRIATAGLRFTSPSPRSSSYTLSRSNSSFAFFSPSYRPAPSNVRTTFFTHGRYLSSAPSSTIPSAFPSNTSSVTAAVAAANASTRNRVNHVTTPKSLPNWLLGCSALVFGIVVIGGLTRLTESGLSITEWQPLTGVLPPITEAQWDVEWDKYRLSPEGIMMNANIDRSEFKKIFYMEWAHRLAGRALGMIFVVPAIYYVTRYRLPRGLPTKLLAIGLGIGFQGFLGWYMVQSGLDQEIVENNSVPRVSQYRLAAHLSAALALYIGMVYTALSLRRDLHLSSSSTPAEVARLAETLSRPAVRRFKGLIGLVGGMVFLTAVSGAFVAGLDAGLVYNEFPTMGGRIVPPTDELLDKRYAKREDLGDNWWRNMLENPVTAQFDHRLLACTTFVVLVAQHMIARRPILRLGTHPLPRATQRWSAWTAAAALGQVTLGITTLLYLVPIPLAAMHQAGSVVLLTCLMGLASTLRRPNPSQAVASLRRGAQALKQSVKSE